MLNIYPCETVLNIGLVNQKLAILSLVIAG